MSAREKILEAADALFGEMGFDAASTREIGELSGVNKALIHYHFKSKEDLLRSVLGRYYEKLAETLKAPILAEGDVRARVHRLIDVYMSFLSENRNFSRIIQREASGGKNAKQIAEWTVPLFGLGMGFLKDSFPATRKGEMAAHQILVSFYGMTVSYFIYGGVLEDLFGHDPFSKKNLGARKKHLKKMADLVLKDIDPSFNAAAK